MWGFKELNRKTREQKSKRMGWTEPSKKVKVGDLVWSKHAKERMKERNIVPQKIVMVLKESKPQKAGKGKSTYSWGGVCVVLENKTNTVVTVVDKNKGQFRGRPCLQLKLPEGEM